MSQNSLSPPFYLLRTDLMSFWMQMNYSASQSRQRSWKHQGIPTNVTSERKNKEDHPCYWKNMRYVARDNGVIKGCVILGSDHACCVLYACLCVFVCECVCVGGGGDKQGVLTVLLYRLVTLGWDASRRTRTDGSNRGIIEPALTKNGHVSNEAATINDLQRMSRIYMEMSDITITFWLCFTSFSLYNCLLTFHLAVYRNVQFWTAHLPHHTEKQGEKLSDVEQWARLQSSFGGNLTSYLSCLRCLYYREWNNGNTR